MQPKRMETLINLILMKFDDSLGAFFLNLFRVVVSYSTLASS